MSKLDELHRTQNLREFLSGFRGFRNLEQNPVALFLEASWVDWTVGVARIDGQDFGISIPVQDFLRDFEDGKYPELMKGIKMLAVGDRVKVYPSHDLFMRGIIYATVTDVLEDRVWLYHEISKLHCSMCLEDANENLEVINGSNES